MPDYYPTMSVQAFNFPDHYLRHRNFVGELTRAVNDLDRADATFFTVNGASAPGVGQGVQFRALNWPRFYLRHQESLVKLHEEPMFGIDPNRPPTYQTPDNELFWADVTFRVVPGLADPTWVSFESVNYPGRFLRHSNYKLRLDPVADDLGRKDATFRFVGGLTRGPVRPQIH